MLSDFVGVILGMLAVIGGYRIAPIVFRSLIVAADETAFSARDRRDIEERFRQVWAEYEVS